MKTYRIKSIPFSMLYLLFFSMIFSCSKESKTSSVSSYVAPSTPTTTPTTTPEAGTAATVIAAMGTGFNLGQTFEKAQQSTDPASITPIIDLYYNAGLRHIRIPVTWMQEFSGNTLADANGNVNFSHPRFLQLKAVIDYALTKKDMYVVLNTHHERWLKNTYNGSAATDAIFTTLWKGIANHFKSYSDHLILEVLNEPDGALGDWDDTNGTQVSPTNTTALALTRQLNKVGYDAIRSTGGENIKRVIMVQPNGQGNASQLDNVYPNKSTLPGEGKDEYLAVEVHTYDPWAFCGQRGSNASYSGKTSIINGVNNVIAQAKLLGVPVNYGEFGVGREINTAERNTDIVREYYKTLVVALRNEKMSATAWDDRGWFALISGSKTSGYNFVNNIVPNFMAP